MNYKFALNSTSPEMTHAIGKMLANPLQPGDLIALCGELGAGKTCFTKGLSSGLEVPDLRIVNSPTFTLLNVYQGRIPIYHFDAYRLTDAAAFWELGFEDFMQGEGICIIEWADRVAEALPDDRLEVHFNHTSETTRQLEFCSNGIRSIELVKDAKALMDDMIYGQY